MKLGKKQQTNKNAHNLKNKIKKEPRRRVVESGRVPPHGTAFHFSQVNSPFTISTNFKHNKTNFKANRLIR
jgi:hypothetical protein